MAVLVLALLAWLLFGLLGDDDADGAEGDGDPITAVSVFFEEDQAALVGREVQIESADVESVVGDKTFWIGQSPDERVFVFLNEETDPEGAEGKVDVEPGQQVTITGTVKEMPPIEEAQQQFETDEVNSADLEGEQIYIEATRVEVTTG